MTRKEISAMSNEELIMQLVFTTKSFSRSWKVYKCDIKDYENITEEMIKRKILSKETVDRILKETTL